MWTGLGAILIIVALVIPIVSLIIRFLVLLFTQAKDKKVIEKESEDVKKDQNKYSYKTVSTTMSTEYRQQKLKEDPVSVIIRKELYTSQYMGDTYHKVYNHRFEFGDTEHLYKYLEKVHNIDNIMQYDSIGRDVYTEYIANVSALVHQYINATGHPDFYDAFTQILEDDHELLMKFIRECHVAEEWKKDNNTIYDCDNYLKDFMRENNISFKISKLTNSKVQMLDDYRHYRSSNPSDIISKFISSEQNIINNKVVKAENDLKSNNVYRQSSAFAIVSIALLLSWLFSSFNIIIGIAALICVICFFIVLISGSKSETLSTNAANEIKNQSAMAPINPIYDWAFNEGEKYAKARCDKLFKTEYEKQNKSR